MFIYNEAHTQICIVLCGHKHLFNNKQLDNND